MVLEGKVWKFGDDVDTDIIIPAEYLVTSDPEKLAAHAMEPVDPEFHKKAKSGDILVAGRNFGCGSSREHAPLALKGLGLGAVVAASYARIFFRNAVNIALPVFECPEAAAVLQTGDSIRIEEESIQNLDTGQRFPIIPIPSFLEELYRQGGLMSYIKAQSKA